MTQNPVCCPPATSLSDAARLMRDHDIGDVLVGSPERGLAGIVTDRDIVVRGLADAEHVGGMTLGDICSSDVCTVQADDSVGERLDHAGRGEPAQIAALVLGARILGFFLGDLGEVAALA